MLATILTAIVILFAVVVVVWVYMAMAIEEVHKNVALGNQIAASSNLIIQDIALRLAALEQSVEEGMKLMADIVQQIKDAEQKILTDVAAKATDVSGQIGGLKDQITALQAQIAAGGTISEADLAPVLDTANQIDAAVNAIGTATSDPAPPAA